MKNVEDVYPLTPAQHGMLFHTIYDPYAGVYVELLSWVMVGGINVGALEQAWQKVVDRHSILRTAFFSESLEEPLQVVRGHVTIRLEHLDWSGLPEAELSVLLTEFLQGSRERGFELAKAPLLRLSLIRLPNGSYRFVWGHQHMILDGWSTSIVLKELFLLYNSYCHNSDLNLPPTVPYREYVRWIQEQNSLDAEAFWQKSLNRFTTPTPLRVELRPTDRAATPASSEIKVSEDATTALQLLARRNQLTMNTIVQGAWALLLSRYSGEPDLVFGTIVSTRPPELPGIEFAVGLFLNALPVRVRVAPEATARQWLRDLQFEQVEARQYQYVSLPQIQSWSKVPAGAPLFQTTLAYENFPVDESLFGQRQGLEIRDFVRYGSLSNYPINVVVEPRRCMLLQIGYDCRHFDSPTVDRMLSHFRTLLESMAAGLEQRLATLSMLPSAYRSQILFEWSCGSPTYTSNICAHHLLEQQVMQAPEAIALHFEDQHLSYLEFNARANKLAHYLQSMGVGPEVIVGLCVERSLEMIIGLVGVIKAGGAYLPLDPSYPVERLAYMRSDSGALIILTQEELVDQLPSDLLLAVCIDSDWDSIESNCDQNPLSGVTPDNLAYVIYTSGSTGRPKGTLLGHRGLSNLCEAQISAFGLNPGGRVLQFASLGFDASVSEVFTTLLAGATLCLVAKEELLPGPGLAESLLDRQITITTLPPSVLAVLPSDDFLALQTLVLAGEASSAELIQEWSSGRRVLNAYGPTEATVCATMAEYGDGLPMGRVAIGYPLQNTGVYLLDIHQHPTPVPVPGDLHIGGVGLARGYLNRADLTADRFIPNPFGPEPGARLYRTGDLARYQPDVPSDGRIEFIGRLDSQIKLRGFRIELEEIESILAKHPDIQDAVASVRVDPQGESMLVAYLVSKSGAELSVTQLRSFLLRETPEHMVPGTFVVLESIPLSPNGKVDRRALPDPWLSKLKSDGAYAAPRTVLEEVLSLIWAQTLGLERVGIDDSFFALGGDSIRSVQILSKVQEKGWTFSIPQLFKLQTIRKLAAELSATEPLPGLPARRPFSLICDDDHAKLSDQIEDAYPLTRLQLGMIFHSQSRPETAIYHSIISIHLKAPLNRDLLQRAIDGIVNLHPVLRTSFDMMNFTEPLQIVHKTVHVPLEVEDLRRLTTAEQQNAIESMLDVEKRRHFDWTCPPLVRFVVHRRTDETFQFTFAAHHSVIDGWSDALVLTQLSHSYMALLAGIEPAYPPLASSFRDYVDVERVILSSKDASRYWTGRLRDCQIGELPRLVEHDGAATMSQFGTIEAQLPGGVTRDLLKLSRDLVIPLKSILLAAHLYVLSVLTGRRDVLTGLVCNARPEERDADRIIGLFLNTLPFRVQLNGGTWVNLVERVFEVEREDLPYRHFPLAQIQVDRGGQNLFESCFNFTHFHLYQDDPISADISVLQTISVTETNLAMLVHFNLAHDWSNLLLSVDYDARRFVRCQIEHVIGYFVNTLEVITSQPHGRYDLCSPLSAAERQQILVELNETQRDLPAVGLVHEPVELQAVVRPDAIALVYEDEQISYEKLNRRSNQAANYLRARGIRPEARVAVLMHRSVDMVVAVLAVLKAGGAYIPLTPVMPRQRVQFMLKDSSAAILLSQESLSDWFSGVDLPITCLDEDWDLIGRESEQAPLRDSAPENLAYVIYTSGSTGRPKGVQITHRSVMNFLDYMVDRPGLHQRDTLSAVTALSFDIAALELFLPLSIGARVILIPSGASADGEALRARLAETGTNVLQATPATWRLIIEAAETLPNQLKGLCGGEALQPDLCSRLLQSTNSLWNMYGPTETTIWSMCGEVRSTAPTVALGDPIGNTQVYILDDRLLPVPSGVSGELYIGGMGLARSYVGDSVLTAERFAPDTYSNDAGARMYETGDLARLRLDGNLEFLGRIDDQVKVRGFRVEPGEIEALLVQHGTVRESVVLAKAELSGEKRLIAYIVSSQEPAPTLGELRSFLKQYLPEYMIPSAMLLLDSMPLTPNGKIDRRALNRLDVTGLEVHDDFAPARNQVEETVVDIWMGLLGLDLVGVHTSFFEVGGHSLLVTKVLSRIRAAYGVEIPVSRMIENPTVAGLAECIEKSLSDDGALGVDEQYATP